MRIAYVINSVEGGGAAAPVPEIARVLALRGAQVRVFALTARDSRALAALDAAGLDPLVRAGGEHDHLAALRWLAAETRNWQATHLWTSLTRATVLGLLLGSWRKLPVVCWQHNAFLKSGNRLLLRALQSRARLWVADSDTVATLTAHRLGVEPARLVTWPIFGADANAPQAPAWEPGQTLQLGSLGRLHLAKGYDVLLTALLRLQAQGFAPPVPLVLTIAGEGRERAHLEALASRIRIATVRLPGHVSRPTDFLGTLHLYLQPSRREGFCIAAHQAMVAALPVLASRVGEMGRTIQDEITGFLVAPDDADALAQRLQQELAEPGQWRAVALAARARVLQQYSTGQFAAAGTRILTRLGQGARRR